MSRAIANGIVSNECKREVGPISLYLTNFQSDQNNLMREEYEVMKARLENMEHLVSRLLVQAQRKTSAGVHSRRTLDLPRCDSCVICNPITYPAASLACSLRPPESSCPSLEHETMR